MFKVLKRVFGEQSHPVVKCPRCKHPFDTDAKYCSRCGTSAEHDIVEANKTLAQWLEWTKEFYHDVLEIDINWADWNIPDVRPKGFDIPIYDSGTLSNQKVQNYFTTRGIELAGNSHDISTFSWAGPTGRPTLVLASSEPIPDAEFLGHSPEYLHGRDDRFFMTIRERLLYDLVRRRYTSESVDVNFGNIYGTICFDGEVFEDALRCWFTPVVTLTQSKKLYIDQVRRSERNHKYGARKTIMVTQVAQKPKEKET